MNIIQELAEWALAACIVFFVAGVLLWIAVIIGVWPTLIGIATYIGWCVYKQLD